MEKDTHQTELKREMTTAIKNYLVATGRNVRTVTIETNARYRTIGDSGRGEYFWDINPWFTITELF